MRARQPDELFSSYESYFGSALPKEFYSLYFKEPVYEFESDISGLRWYTPNLLGDGDYYATLARIYSWYYNPGSWDKLTALDIILGLKPASILEVGCGDGWLLDRLRERNLSATGVEINESAVKKCKDRGLKVFLPAESGMEAIRNDVVCLLQTIEHVPNPREFLATLVQQYQPEQIILSAPCFESLLGYTSDPLSWPPHHATAWSRKAFDTLAGLLGFQISTVRYSPLSFEEFNWKLDREDSRKLPNIPSIQRGTIGSLKFKMYQYLGRSWACRGHSILVVMSKRTKTPKN
jgi:SAM-dependent methyltransferase